MERSAVRHRSFRVAESTHPGRFIVVEGIEGSGKTTLLSNLAAAFRARGRDVVLTREPGGTELGNRLRAAFVDPANAIAPLAEAFIVNASRAQHVVEVIEPALRDGSMVLCDRFASATLAYQGFGRGVALETLRTLATIATQRCEVDHTLLVDIDVAESRVRVAERARATGVGIDRLEREGVAFHERVRNGYLELAHADAERWTILDGMQSPTELCEAALHALAANDCI